MEHHFLERGRDKGVELMMPTCQQGEEDSDKLVELVCSITALYSVHE